MPGTLLSICRRVVRGTGILAPSAIAQSSDETAQRLFEAAQMANETMQRINDWTVLIFEHDFTTAVGINSYTLPNGFSRILSNTAWQDDAFRRTRGNISPAEWQYRRNSIAQLPDSRPAFRIKTTGGGVNTFFVSPTPSSIYSLIFEYVSAFTCKSAGGSFQTTWNADTDISFFDEGLMVLCTRWLFKQSNGLPHVEDREAWEDQKDLAIAHETAPPAVDFSGGVMLWPFANVPDGGYGQ